MGSPLRSADTTRLRGLFWERLLHRIQQRFELFIWQRVAQHASGSGDVAFFTLSAYATMRITGNPNIFVGGLALGSSSAAVSITGTGASTLTIGSFGITNLPANPFTILWPSHLVLASSSTWTANGPVVVDSAITTFDLAGNFLTLSDTSTSSLIGAQISSSSGGITKFGAGTWTLGATNLYSGRTEINEGSLMPVAAITHALPR